MMTEEKEHPPETAEAGEGEAPVEESVEEKKARIPEEITILDTDLEKLTSDAKSFKDKYLRLLAEAENTRKRLHKERQDMMKFAIRDVILEMLTPLDHLESALAHSDQTSGEVKHWAMGFKMILTQFKDVLANHDVRSFDTTGTTFDPHLHDAVEMVETEESPDGTVIEELLRGYKMGDMTIRPARVKIAKTPEKTAEGTKGDDGEQE